jgi:predicted nucleotide-binding protein (sugar kinase/HSP70/actin superfamily)
MSSEKNGYSPEVNRETVDEKLEIKKIKALIELFLNLKKNGSGSKGQLEQVQQRLSSALDERMKRMVKTIEKAYSIFKGTQFDLKNPEHKESLKRDFGVDVSAFPYVISLDTEQGIAELIKYYNTGKQEE